jgi:hypothetical protein
MDVIASVPVDTPAIGQIEGARGGVAQPDPDIECIVTLQPARAVSADAVAAARELLGGRYAGSDAAATAWAGCHRRTRPGHRPVRGVPAAGDPQAVSVPARHVRCG